MPSNSVVMGKGAGAPTQGRASLHKLNNPGDILVCVMTDPSMLDDIRQAGGVVTDEGGVLCHAAIVCMEFGIPFIVGTGIATKFIKDGEFVELNPSEGTVTLLGGA